MAYLFTYDIRRGESEPELAEALAAGVEYDYRISRADLPQILGRRTNVWLILQGLTAQVAFGSLVWLPVLFPSRAEAQGYSAATAIVVGSVFATLFQLGGVLSIVGGLVGDRAAAAYPAGAGPGRRGRHPRRPAVLPGPVLRADADRRARRRAAPARWWAPCWPAWSPSRRSG